MTRRSVGLRPARFLRRWRTAPARAGRDVLPTIRLVAPLGLYPEAAVSRTGGLLVYTSTFDILPERKSLLKFGAPQSSGPQSLHQFLRLGHTVFFACRSEIPAEGPGVLTRHLPPVIHAPPSPGSKCVVTR